MFGIRSKEGGHMNLFILGLLQKTSRGGGGNNVSGTNVSGTLEISGFFAETIIGQIITEGDE